MKQEIIKCPNCSYEIDINELIYQKINKELQLKFEKESKEKEQIYLKKIDEIDSIKLKLEKEKKLLDEDIRQRVQELLLSEKIKLEKELQSKIEESNKILLTEKDKELEEQNQKIKDFLKMQQEFEKFKRESLALEEKLKLESEKKLSELIIKERENLRNELYFESELKIKERDLLVESLKKQIDSLQRKIEIGSQQSQGEAQELFLEELLKKEFPFDIINEVKKGQKGGDCIQIVRDNYGEICGKIYYESKRTKDFNYNWIQKLKDDNLEERAHVLVIVTQAMPNLEEKYNYIDGVWICSINEIKWLSRILRYNLVELKNLSDSQVNIEGKMANLYKYLTSNEFKNQFEAIINGFELLKKSHDDEKKKIMKLWAEKEKHFEKILHNAVRFYGSIKAIAKESIPEIPSLDSPFMLIDGDE